MRKLLSGLTLAVATLAPAVAFAHPGHGDQSGFVHGFLHPITGLDHILAMDSTNLRTLWRQAPIQYRSKIRLFRDLDPQGMGEDVPDPYYGGETEFDKVLASVKPGMAPLTPAVVYDKLPSDQLHGWKYLRVGPDGYLYVPVGAPCNVCERDPDRYANIMRINADGSGLEVYARGVRNSVGFDWHPASRELWFTDNGRDLIGDDPLSGPQSNHESQRPWSLFPQDAGMAPRRPAIGDNQLVLCIMRRVQQRHHITTQGFQ